MGLFDTSLTAKERRMLAQANAHRDYGTSKGVPQPRLAWHVERAFNPDAVFAEKSGTPLPSQRLVHAEEGCDLVVQENGDLIAQPVKRYRADACQACGVYALDISPSDAVCRCGKPLFSNETRIANLERMVKRIAAHLGMEG